MRLQAKIRSDGVVENIAVADFRWPSTGLPDLWVVCGETTRIGDKYDFTTQTFTGA